MISSKNIAVVLFQLGGPDSPEAVNPFLYNLFSDPDIFNFPGAKFFRKPLARLIASRRSKIVVERYNSIGGKSPITDLTLAQARALEAELSKHTQARVFVAMRYWHPFADEIISEIKKENFRQIVLLPLYPQYSRVTTSSSLKEWNRQARAQQLDHVPQITINSYHDHPLYIEAIIDNINRTYSLFPNVSPADIDLVFSAHGVPRKLIDGGDPYQRHIEETVRLIVDEGQWKSPHILCYQSRVRPGEWLKPSLTDTIKKLAAEGRKHLLVIPIAFVTEHIETLHEINIECREEACDLGITQFEMMPALNDHPKFIRCLAEMVLSVI